jgi:hypothetical protein
MDTQLIEFFGGEPLGLPCREAYAAPYFRDLHAALDRVYATGVPEQLQRPVGMVTVLPWRQDGRLVGVSTHVAVVARPHRLPLVVPVGALASLGAALAGVL